MDDRSIARWRLRSQRLAGGTYASATDAVGGLLAVQAENYAQASWAVGTRTSGLTEPLFRQLFDDGAILRTHIIRPTWHFVLPDDIRWLTTVTAPRMQPWLERQQRAFGLDEGVVDAALERIVGALVGGVHLTRAGLAERLRKTGLPAEGLHLGMVLMTAEMSALICSGAMQGNEQTWALLDERAPHARRLARAEALAELAVRYFTGHGPATERDLSYWATLSLADVRAGIAGAGNHLDSFDHGGRTYWYGGPPPDDRPLEPPAQLLQILDEYYRGYQDSRYLLDVEGLVPRGRETSLGMTLVDGQMVGNMRRTLARGDVVFDVALHRSLSQTERDAVHDAADRYGAFLGLAPRLRLCEPPPPPA